LDQVDFYLQSSFIVDERIARSKKEESKDLERYSVQLQDLFRMRWTTDIVGGKEAIVALRQLDASEDLKTRFATPAMTGGTI
jgi:hypothetical protein